MAIGVNQSNQNNNFKFGNNKIEITNEYKYLGTIFSNDKNVFKQNQNN